MSKLTIPEDDPIRTFLPELQPLDKQQIGEFSSKLNLNPFISEILTLSSLVLINPIVEKKQHRVIALLLVSQRMEYGNGTRYEPLVCCRLCVRSLLQFTRRD